jgi:hypothetical protein
MAEGTALERACLAIHGVRSELHVEDGRITITKEVPTRDEPSTVTVEAHLVRGTSVNPPSRGGRGWLHLAVVGGSPAPPTELAAANDPYTLPIGGRGTGSVRRFVRLVDKHVAARGMPQENGPNEGQYSSGVSLTSPVAHPGKECEPPAVPDRDTATYLRNLDELLRVGALTDEEVRRARSRLLARARD